MSHKQKARAKKATGSFLTYIILTSGEMSNEWQVKEIINE